MKNAHYYHDLADFVLTELASKGRTVRPQELTTPTRQKTLDCFNDAGWIETFEGTCPFRRSFSPKDNSTRIQMVDGKLYRHPAATDLIAKRKDLARRFLEAKAYPFRKGQISLLTKLMQLNCISKD